MDVPHRVVIGPDGESRVPLTPEELAEHEARGAAYVQSRQDAAGNRERLLTTVRSSADPAVAALAELLGLLPADAGTEAVEPKGEQS